MEHFIERLDTLLDEDPFREIDGNLLSQNDHELLEKYRLKYHEERKRIRDERKTKTFEQIMEDLLQELSNKPDISSFYRTIDEQLLTTANSTHKDAQTAELDTSHDEQDDLEHFTGLIDPSKSIGRSIVANDPLQTSTYVVYPLTKSPTIPPESRKLRRYTEQPRRNTYTLEDSSEEDNEIINTKREYVRLNSQGFDPSPQENLFNNVTDARSTFTIPKKRSRLTHQEAQNILHKYLGAFVKGHLTRQLFRTEHVKNLIQTVNDSKKFAVECQTQCLHAKAKLEPDDIKIIDQLIRQVESVLNEIHSIFTKYPPARKMIMIVQNEQNLKLRKLRTNERMVKDFSLERPIIDPVPKPTVKTQNQARPNEYHRNENIRRHVTTVPTRSTQSKTNVRNPPLRKTASTQRKTRPLTSTQSEPGSNLQRSSSAHNTNNTNIFRPPIRYAPASPLFRNRPK